jgi:hypothetical protein
MRMLADGIEIEFAAIGCFAPLLLLLAIAGVESLVSWPITGLRPRQTFRVWLAANALSALAGLIVLWCSGGNFVFWEAAMQRHDLADAIHQTLARGLAYLGESVAVEALVWVVAIRRSPGLRPRHLVWAVVAANVITYAILIPLLATALVGGDLLRCE